MQTTRFCRPRFCRPLGEGVTSSRAGGTARALERTASGTTGSPPHPAGPPREDRLQRAEDDEARAAEHHGVADVRLLGAAPPRPSVTQPTGGLDPITQTRSQAFVEFLRRGRFSLEQGEPSDRVPGSGALGRRWRRRRHRVSGFPGPLLYVLVLVVRESPRPEWPRGARALDGHRESEPGAQRPRQGHFHTLMETA